MDLKKIAPWNWFKHEEEESKGLLPIRRETRSEPHPLQPLQREIDRIFEDAFRNFPSLPFGFNRDFPSLVPGAWLKPTMDIAAGEKEYTVTVELPGVEEKEIQVEIVGDALRIHGEKKQEKEEKEKDFYRVERSYGSFQRILNLPDDADRDAISATFKQGVMKIVIPRKSTPKAETKKIAVKID